MSGHSHLSNLTRRGVVAGLGSVGAAGLGGCDLLSSSFRVRLLCKITAEVAGKVYSNGTVFEIRYTDKDWEWKRHVPYCDLGPHGLLFWDANGGRSLLPFTLVREVFGIPNAEGYVPIDNFRRRWRRTTGPQSVDLNIERDMTKLGPTSVGLVHIWDRNLKTRDAGFTTRVVNNPAQRQSIKDLRKTGIVVTSMTFETTTAAITDVIGQLLPNVDLKNRNFAIIQDGNSPTNQMLRVGHLVGKL